MAADTDAGDGSDGQFRGYWVDAFNDGLYTPEQVSTLVDEARDANLNAIVAEVVRRGDFFGDEALPPRTEADIADDFDPLAALIEEADEAGIEVHAWMVVNQMWNRAEPPEADDHAFNRHGPDSDDPWVSVREDGAVHSGDNQYFFDPGHPGAADYIARTARSIVENYDVDGINLDYIRYPTPEEELYQVWGYNEVALDRFRDATGRDDRPEYTDDEWEAWRRKQITNLVRRIYLECYEADPDVRLTADTITWWKGPQERDGGFAATGAYFQVLQNWPAWMEEGILDTNIPMNYKRGGDSEMFADWADFAVDHQFDRDVAVGSALYLNDRADNVAQIRTAVDAGTDGNESIGWNGYSYANPSNAVLSGEETPTEGRSALEEALTESDPTGADEPLFAEPAEVPDMPWKSEEAHVAGVVETRDGDPVDDTTMRAKRRGEVVATTETTGNGWFGFVGLDPGRYHVSVEPGEVAGPRNEKVRVDAGSLATVDFEVNREVPDGDD
ncbi:family 10 glycosylhydrolase [Halosimplex marinum]|uniref:family 10 glycosylhydrolase n=1 Tax=Halosimplex marinum TaxID=3396620 RepID=UPI003F54853F